MLRWLPWTALSVLVIVLFITGCVSQPLSSESSPSPTPQAGGSGGLALSAPQAAQGQHPPAPAPSATRLAPTPTSTPAPPGPTPTSTPVPSPTPTPAPTLRRLTDGGCCTQPFWSPDSRWVLFIDKPGPDQPVGIWGVDVTQAQPAPRLVTERIAYYTTDLAFRIQVDQGSTRLERMDVPLSPATPSSEAASQPETTWELPAGGEPVSISPGYKRIVWQVSDEDIPVERRATQVWVANLDGSDARMIASLPRGGFSGWVSDDMLLLSGRESFTSQEQILFTYALTDKSQVELARGKRLRGGLLSPDGAWLAYFMALDEDTSQNGIWLVRTDGSGRRKLERDLFGAYQWRDSHRLLIIPFQADATQHQIWELDANTGQSRRLIDPQITPFKIANGDWTVSPDGRYVVFVESRDRNLWALTLPD